MAKALKACFNENCEAYKKVKYSAKITICPKCGNTLDYVCKECWTKLDSGDKKYCVWCENKLKDYKEQPAKYILYKTQKVADAIKIAGDEKREKEKLNTLNIPEEYKKTKYKTQNVGFSVKEKSAFEYDNGQYNSFVIVGIISEKAALSFNNNQIVIDAIHNSIKANQGLIAVESGNTFMNRPYVFYIMKHRLMMGEKYLGVDYTLVMNVKFEDKIYYINASFTEKGSTGMRDAIGFELFLRENPNLEYPYSGWNCDPYDKAFTKGFLMNQSEKEQYDSRFPDHPLTKARDFANYIIENN